MITFYIVGKNLWNYIVIKMSKVKDKKRILKAKEKQLITYKGILIRGFSSFFSRISTGQTRVYVIFKVLKEKTTSGWRIMNSRKRELFHCDGEITGVKCINEVQQDENGKLQCSSTQRFYYFCETMVSRDVLGREIGQDEWQRGDWVGDAHVETRGGKTSLKRLGFERKGKGKKFQRRST